jgi:hypothetical protein
MRWLLLWFAFLASTSSTFSQSFDLVERSGVVSGRIMVEAEQLMLWDGDGSQLVFVRDRSYDTADRQFIGYYNVPLARVFKFPRCGHGQFIYADLDDLIPADAWSRRVIRPTNSRQVWGIGDYGPPVISVPMAPAGLGGTGFGATGFGGPVLVGPSPIGIAPLTPRSMLLDSQSIPLPDLPPANLQLVNSGPRDAQVTLTDAKQGGASKTFRIPAGGSQPLKLHRDAGFELVQRFEVISPFGDVVTEEKRRIVPPPIRYEVTVHQLRVQSIAIDRTEGGNNAIEDVNMQGQAVGSFPLPPGPELTDGTIDVYRTASQMGNQGAIGPLVPANPFPEDRVSPLEKAILDRARLQPNR